MPRKARIDAPGALQHIIVRGIDRRKIFFDNPDRNDFLDRLGGILSDSKTPCFAWAFMTNHLHLLLRKGAAPIATVMRRLLTGYAVSLNPAYSRIIVAMVTCFRIDTPVKSGLKSIASRINLLCHNTPPTVLTSI
jgi:REP element-mobilizing transposase RayT